VFQRAGGDQVPFGVVEGELLRIVRQDAYAVRVRVHEVVEHTQLPGQIERFVIVEDGRGDRDDPAQHGHPSSFRGFRHG
jgi:hypothetical protein